MEIEFSVMEFKSALVGDLTQSLCVTFKEENETLRYSVLMLLVMFQCLHYMTVRNLCIIQFPYPFLSYTWRKNRHIYDWQEEH